MDVYDFVPEISAIQLPRKISLLPFRSLPLCASLSPPPSHQPAVPLAGPPHVEFPCTTASVHTTQHSCDSVRISPSSFVPLRPRLPRLLFLLNPANPAADLRCNHRPVPEHPCTSTHTGANTQRRLCNCTMFYFYFYSFLMDQTVQTLTHSLTRTHTCALVYISSLYLYTECHYKPGCSDTHIHMCTTHKHAHTRNFHSFEEEERI